MAALTICSDFRTPEKKICHGFYFCPSICHEVMGPDVIFVFWVLSFKPAFPPPTLEFSLSLFFPPYNPINVGNLISFPSAFSKSSLYIWKFSVHILLKHIWKDFSLYLASMWNEYSCIVVWTFFGIACLWHWNENRPFPALWPLLNFPNLLTLLNGISCRV